MIVATGVTITVLLLLFQSGLRSIAYRDETQIARGISAKSPFNGQRAFEDLKRVCALGPRPPGSPASEKLRGLIRDELTKAGLQVREQAFDADTPLGKKSMVNLVGIVQGTKDGIIILGNHYDTKYFPDFVFVGANDGGSTTAWMLEMARALGPKREGMSVWLLWFDGEEAFKEWSDTDSLYGSRAFVRDLRQRGELSKVKAMINVDMIGDRYLGIQRDGGAPAWLSNAVWTTASELGLGGYFLSESGVIEDDHLPFRQARVPAIDIIDFQYGGSMLDHKNLWHTANDTMGRVSADSLQVVGDVIYHTIPSVEGYLKGQTQD